MSQQHTHANSFGFSADTLREIASYTLEYAKSRGATAAEVDVSEGFGQSVSVRKSDVETIEYNRDKGVGVTVYLGQQRGNASTSDFSRKALEATVDAALSIARFTAADPCAGLADEALLCREFADLELYHPWDLSVEHAIELAQRCEAAAFDFSPEIHNSEGASVSTQQGQFISANSLGFIGGYATSRHSLSCSVIAGDDDLMQRDDWYDSRRNAQWLESPEVIGRKAAERALARVGARRLPTGDMPVMFHSTLAPALIGNFVYAVSGGSLYRKSSFLLDSLGKPVFSPVISISERPHLKGALGSCPFDDEGVRTLDREVVSDGVLQGYFLSSYSARKLGMQTTGNAGGSHTLIVKPGDQDFNALLKTLDRGLLVTELLGHGVNYVTGDYSRGAAGFWVENGQIAYPVEEITIAGNLKTMFQQIVAVGNDVHDRGSKHCGSILIENMTIAGE